MEIVTLEKLRYEVYEQLQIKSDDSEVSSRYVDRLIHQKRSTFVHNYLSGLRGPIPSKLIQQIPCIEMEVTTSATCCSPMYAEGCKVVIKSKKPVPQFISYGDGQAITSITANDFMYLPHNKNVRIDSLPFIGNGRFNKNQLYFFILDGYLYGVSRDETIGLIEIVTMTGVLENPSNAGDYICGGQPCWTSSDSQYPLEDWMWDLIKKVIYQEISTKQSTPTDTLKDNKDQANQQPVEIPRGGQGGS